MFASEELKGIFKFTYKAGEGRGLCWNIKINADHKTTHEFSVAIPENVRRVTSTFRSKWADL